MEYGFFHPQRGYWQTIGEVSDDIKYSYPEGTIEVPIKPGENYYWNGKNWMEAALVPATESAVRKIRNRLLRESDWTQLPDASVDKQAWATYRQALRDLPQQSDFPNNITWPEPPK